MVSETVSKKPAYGRIPFVFIVYLCLFYIGQNFTMTWQRDVSTCDKAIIWFCSVIPALCASVSYIIFIEEKIGLRLFVSIITWILTYLVIFVCLFFIFAILSIIETLGVGFTTIIILMLLFGSGPVVLVIIIE